MSVTLFKFCSNFIECVQNKLPLFDAGNLGLLFSLSAFLLAFCWGYHFKDRVYEFKYLVLFILWDAALAAIYLCKFG